MAEFYSVSLEEMDAFLRPMRFQPVDLTYRRSPVKEWVYQRPVPSRANHFVRVYTGINRYGQQQNQSRGVGKDAIRVQVIYRDEAGNETLVTQPKRVHRVQGWADNLANRLEEINRTRPQVAFDSRGKPMTLRKGKTGWFWGSSDYPRYKETRPFASESEESEFYAGVPIYEINSLEELREVLADKDFHKKDDTYWFDWDERKARPHSNPLTETHLFRINFSGVYALRSIHGPSKLIYGINLLQSATKAEPQFSSYQSYLSPPMEKIKESLPVVNNRTEPIFPRNTQGRGIVSAFGPYTSLMAIPQETSYNDPRLQGKGINNIIFDLEGLVFGYHHYKIPTPDGSIQDLDMVGEIEILGGVPEKNVVFQSVPPKNVFTPRNREWFNPEAHSEAKGKNFGWFTKKSKISDYTDEEMIEHWNQFAAEDNYEATYGKAQAKIRRRLKKKIKAQAIMGTKAGQWSARKSQELKRQYEAACEKRGLAAYKGQKTQSQKNLSNWSQQKWRTASGKNSSDTGEPYFPAKAVEALKKKGLYAKAKRQKAAATKAGKQSARYSDDIRAVVRKYRAESDAIPKNWELIEYEGHPALYRHIATADYNTTWQLVEFADDLNLRLKHHATVQFTASSIEIWLWTHDSETITYRDEYWAEAYDELLQLATIVDNLEFDSESVPEDWEDIKWKEEKPEHIGDSAEWESEQGSDWGSLRPMQLNERGDYYPTEEAYIEAMLRRFPKMNIHGERGCPVCGSETLFMRETTGKGLKWRCYGCNYSDESLSEKSKKIDTLEKFGLTLRCPDCGEDFKAYNREAIRYHQKKCGA